MLSSTQSPTALPKVGGREDPDASGKDQAIGGLGAGPTSLAFEDTELLTEGEKLDLERGV